MHILVTWALVVTAIWNSTSTVCFSLAALINGPAGPSEFNEGFRFDCKWKG